jgi:hypothetical protein
MMTGPEPDEQDAVDIVGRRGTVATAPRAREEGTGTRISFTERPVPKTEISESYQVTGHLFKVPERQLPERGRVSASERNWGRIFFRHLVRSCPNRVRSVEVCNQACTLKLAAAVATSWEVA